MNIETIAKRKRTRKYGITEQSYANEHSKCFSWQTKEIAFVKKFEPSVMQQITERQNKPLWYSPCDSKRYNWRKSAQKTAQPDYSTTTSTSKGQARYVIDDGSERKAIAHQRIMPQ